MGFRRRRFEFRIGPERINPRAPASGFAVGAMGSSQAGGSGGGVVGPRVRV